MPTPMPMPAPRHMNMPMPTWSTRPPITVCTAARVVARGPYTGACACAASVTCRGASSTGPCHSGGKSRSPPGHISAAAASLALALPASESGCPPARPIHHGRRAPVETPSCAPAAASQRVERT